MSENSQKILCGSSFVPSEELDDEEIPEEVAREALISSSAVDLIDNIGKPDFKYIYFDLVQDIKSSSFKFQRRFIENFIEKMDEVYEYRFPINFDIADDAELEDFYEFIQFLEFDNAEYFCHVWKHLGADIYKIDIDLFCKNNDQKIINECEKQVASFDFNKKINLFLRTYYKEGFIKWFIENTKVAKVAIKIAQIS